MTPRPAGDAENGMARVHSHARAPDTVPIFPPVPAASQDPDTSRALVPGTCTCQSYGRGPGDPSRAQPHDACPSPRKQLTPLQLIQDILSNRENMLIGLILLIMAIAAALAVPAGLVYIVLGHVPAAAKISVGSVTTVVITVATSLLSSNRWRKRGKRRRRRISEKS